MSKLKTYVLILSDKFPKGHCREGQPTFFSPAISNGKKLHTIRGNFEWWQKRIHEVQAGRAVLSVRRWSGKPYRSKQVVVRVLTVADGVGVQRISPGKSGTTFLAHATLPGFTNVMVRNSRLANNDGLYLSDFDSWFKGWGSGDKAIIHFTPFRYVNRCDLDKFVNLHISK